MAARATDADTQTSKTHLFLGCKSPSLVACELLADGTVEVRQKVKVRWRLIVMTTC